MREAPYIYGHFVDQRQIREGFEHSPKALQRLRNCPNDAQQSKGCEPVQFLSPLIKSSTKKVHRIGAKKLPKNATQRKTAGRNIDVFKCPKSISKNRTCDFISPILDLYVL